MSTIIKIALAFVLVASSIYCSAQIRTQSYDATSTGYDTPAIRVFADSRLDVVVEKHKTAQGGMIYNGRGYRVQIYSGSDRAKANSVKLDFMRRFPEVKAYMTYIQPHFRVRVGNFSSRGDASELYKKTLAIYGACMIVPDIVTINTFENERTD